MNKNKNKFAYLVYCNVNPIVYGVYSNKKKALEYAYYLIDYRQKEAIKNNRKFGYYHYCTEELKYKSPFDEKEKLILSVCLNIIPEHDENYNENGCLIKVMRHLLQN